MKLSTKARYGLRATAELALRKIAGNGNTRPVSISTIAKRQGIPEQYLRQIFVPLKKAGIVEAVRGKSGGFLLARGPEEISALEVVQAMGEELGPVFCVSEPGACERVSECPTHSLWCKLGDAVRKALETTTVKELAEMCPRRGSKTLPSGHTFDI